MKRRTFVTAVGGLTTAGLAGCLDDETQSDTFSFSAHPVTAPEFIRDQTGFSEVEAIESEITETIEYENDEQSVTFVEWVTVFENPDEDVFDKMWVHTEPVRQVGDKTLQPHDFENVEPFIEYLESDWQDFTVDVPEQTHEIEVLDMDASIDEYLGAVDSSTFGLLDVHLYYCSFTHEDEQLTILAATSVDDHSESSIFTLLQMLEHPVDDVDEEPEDVNEEDVEDSGNESG